MGTNSAPLVVDLFLFCYERFFMGYFVKGKQNDMIDVFNLTSINLDDFLNIENIYKDTHNISNEFRNSAKSDKDCGVSCP